jgi:hypothetical protein
MQDGTQDGIKPQHVHEKFGIPSRWNFLFYEFLSVGNVPARKHRLSHQQHSFFLEGCCGPK